MSDWPAAIAVVIAAILALIGAVHVYWAMGKMPGGGAAIPEIDGRAAMKPSRAATLAVALALFVAALIVLVQSGMIGAPFAPQLFMWATGVLCAIFLGRAIGDFRLVGFFKRVRGTRFARLDTLYYSPLCVALGLGLLLVATR